MKKLICLLPSVLLSSLCFADNSNVPQYGNDWPTKPFWSVEAKYRFKYDYADIYDLDIDCKKLESVTESQRHAAGVKSTFTEQLVKDEERIIDFSFVNNTGNNSPVINKPYKVCNDKLLPYQTKRVGGIDTGILVVPYKVRSGDLYGESSLGPYIALRGNSISLLGTFGITQVSVADLTNQDVKTESGLSYAAGLVWTIKDEFDIGLIVGRDHLSGSAGDNFKFQDKTWWSFALGYNLTRKK